MRGTTRALKRYVAAEGTRPLVMIVTGTGIVLVLLVLFILATS